MTENLKQPCPIHEELKSEPKVSESKETQDDGLSSSERRVAGPGPRQSTFVHFQQQIHRIDHLERQFEARVTKLRRRMHTILLQYEGLGNRSSQAATAISAVVHSTGNHVPSGDRDANGMTPGGSSSALSSLYTSYRHSRLRLFVTHQRNPLTMENTLSGTNSSKAVAEHGTVAPNPTVSSEAATATHQGPLLDSDKLQNLVVPDATPTIHSAVANELFDWSLRIEGRLLIDHLDHRAAELFDQRTGYVEPIEELDRSKTEPEEFPIPAIRCTHFFDRLVVEFQTVFQPVVYGPLSKQRKAAAGNGLPSTSMTNASNKKSSSRRSSTEAVVGGTNTTEEALATGVNDESLLMDPSQYIASSITTYTWERTKSTDAGGWCIPYCSPSPPPSTVNRRYVVRGIVAKIQLYPHCGGTDSGGGAILPPTGNQHSADANDPMYQVSPALANALFPHYGYNTNTDSTNDDALSNNARKRKIDVVDNETEISSTSDQHPVPSLINDVHIPLGLTWPEIASGFFTYIRDRGLCHELDHNRVVCDEVLATIMGCIEFPFSELFARLMQRRSIQPCHQLPVKLTYVMEASTALPKSMHTPLNPHAPPSLLQLDTDVWVPQLFPYRVRELMRRMKRRELEYTSSRTKAKNIVVGSRRVTVDEDIVRQRMEHVIVGRAVGPDYVPILAALAQAAPANSLARHEAVVDARISHLFGKLVEHQTAADDARRLLRVCRNSLK